MGDQDILFVREPNNVPPGDTVFFRQASHRGQRAGADASSRKSEPHPVEARLTLRMDPHVIGLLITREDEFGMALEPISKTAFDFGKNSLRAPIGDEEFEAGPIALCTIPFVAKDLADRLGDRPGLFRRNPDRQYFRQVRSARKPSPDLHPESRFPLGAKEG